VTRDKVEIVRCISEKLSQWNSKIEELNELEREEQNAFLREIKFAGFPLTIIMSFIGIRLKCTQVSTNVSSIPFICKEYASKMTKAKWAAMVAEHETYLRSHTPRPNWGDNNNTAGFHYNPEASTEENAQV
jgi:hypothetical protein